MRNISRYCLTAIAMVLPTLLLLIGGCSKGDTGPAGPALTGTLVAASI